MGRGSNDVERAMVTVQVSEPGVGDEERWPSIAGDEMERYSDLFMEAYDDESATGAFRRLASHGIHVMHSLFAARVEVDRLRRELAETKRAAKTFPIQLQRGARAHPTSIPWEVADLAFSVYAAQYGTGQSLERLAERGGFSPSEMDEFLPDWRKRCELR